MFLKSRCLATTRRYKYRHIRLVGGIYEVRRWDWLRCHDIDTKFDKDWSSYSKVNMGEIHRQHCVHISLILYFLKESRLKMWKNVLSLMIWLTYKQILQIQCFGPRLRLNLGPKSPLYANCTHLLPAWLTLRPWRNRQCVPAKHRWTSII
jgi:hypothetical protein